MAEESYVGGGLDQLTDEMMYEKIHKCSLRYDINQET